MRNTFMNDRTNGRGGPGRPDGWPAIGLAASLAALGIVTPCFGEGSEIPDGSVTIDSLPFTDTGDTSDNLHEFDVVCPFSGSSAPDVFYAITPKTDVSISITLCQSDYDTKVYVLDANLNDIACNDDECEDANGDPTLRSHLKCVPLAAGQTYHIGVDGFDLEAGPYEITVSACVPPEEWACPCGDPPKCPEGEACVVGSEDDFNGGCNSEPPVFSPIVCDQTYCGTTWSIPEGGRRDTDWYQIVTTEETTFTLRGSFAFDGGLIGFIFMRPGQEGTGDCDEVLGAQPFDIGDAGEALSITTDLMPAGTHWFFVAPSTGDAVGCPVDTETNYWIELTCETVAPPCPSDIDGDGDVDFQDLIKLLGDWGVCPK